MRGVRSHAQLLDVPRAGVARLREVGTEARCAGPVSSAALRSVRKHARTVRQGAESAQVCCKVGDAVLSHRLQAIQALRGATQRGVTCRARTRSAPHLCDFDGQPLRAGQRAHVVLVELQGLALGCHAAAQLGRIGWLLPGRPAASNRRPA
jgi:hypothetical protein